MKRKKDVCVTLLKLEDMLTKSERPIYLIGSCDNSSLQMQRMDPEQLPPQDA